MKFRRKADSPTEVEVDASLELDEPSAPPPGPHDVSAVEGDGIDRVDLGSLLIPIIPDREIRLQLKEATQEVLSVQIVGPNGAVEVRAFAAPRNGDLWSRAREEITAEAEGRGNKVEERVGRFGSEVISQIPVDTPDGPSLMASRMVGFNGDRWLLRGSFLGEPATNPALADAWDETFAAIVVRRGSHALPVGEPLPLKLPPTQTETSPSAD